ncbi:MAG: ribosome silencing factor [Propionibacteriaceae bacterium]|jgi:ribosome-associated protein|nr:ribosome silencing factor [Propionibacteriaceae bacterium]
MTVGPKLAEPNSDLLVTPTADQPPTEPGASARSIELTRLAAQAAADKLGTDIVALDVSQRLGLTDVFLLVSGANDRQVSAIVDAIEERLLAEGVKPIRREGDSDTRWVLLDFFDIVVHVQLAEARTLFALDRLWHDCPTIDLDLA